MHVAAIMVQKVGSKVGALLQRTLASAVSEGGINLRLRRFMNDEKQRRREMDWILLLVNKMYIYCDDRLFFYF